MFPQPLDHRPASVLSGLGFRVQGFRGLGLFQVGGGLDRHAATGSALSFLVVSDVPATWIWEFPKIGDPNIVP